MDRRGFAAGATLVFALVSAGHAQIPMNPSAPASSPAPPCVGCATVPALTPVRVEVLATLSSKISKSGDTFPIRLAAPIVVDGHEVIPAGSTGIGEVVHAKKSGGSGAGGELVLAARYFEVGGRHLRLRSFHLAPEGKSNINTVNAINVASAAAVPGVALIGFLITGHQATVAEGTVAEAKTAEAFTIAPAMAPTAAPTPVAAVATVPSNLVKGTSR